MKNIVEKTRKEMNMSQEELSEKSKVSRTIISALENGTKEKITNVTLERIAAALNKKVTDIFFIE